VSKISLHRFDRLAKIIVWPKEEVTDRQTDPRAQNCGGNIQIWGCMAALEVGHLIRIDDNLSAT
jgi:hypothetical protein